MKKQKKMAGSASSSAIYSIGMLGAAVYFVQHASNLGEILLGLLKAILWPGVILYRVLELLKF